MTTRTGARLAWMAFGLVGACFVISLVAAALIAARGALAAGEFAEAVLFLTAMLSFPVVGVLIASRRPGNAVGWLLLAIGLVWERRPSR